MRKMKDSGIKWIGKIPNDWKIKPIGVCFKERKEKVSDYEWKPLSVTKQGVVQQLETAAKSDAHDDRKKVCKGDFVINSRSDRKQSCGLSELNGSVSLINIVLENKSLNEKYVKYLLKNYGFAEEFYRWGSGIVADLWSTKYQQMKRIMIPIPPDEEQEKIASFLDMEIVKINKIIEKTEETIEDYRKYKKVIITKAITKGLDKNAKMKDSKVKCIGRIPANWSLLYLKYVTRFQEGPGIMEKDFRTEGVPLIRISGVKNNIVSQEGCNYLDSIMVKKKWNHFKLKKDDIVISASASMGTAAIVDNETVDCIPYTGLIRFPVSENLNNIFLKYYLISDEYMEQINIQKTGSTIQHYGPTHINRVKIALPCIDEQKQIVEFLNEKCDKINILIKNKEEIISELENYKKSLIYEYVTGKKEVKYNKALNNNNSKGIKINCRDNIFAQAILLCKIIEKLNDHNLGRVKAEKALYLIEKDIGFDFKNDYVREAAGPLSVALYKSEAITKKNKWLNIIKKPNYVKYEMLPKFNDYKKYYENYYSGYDDKIEKIIDIIKDYSKDKAEMVATLYASWNDFIIKGEQVSDIQIVKDVRENWNDTKKRFSEKKWIDVLNEMKQIGLTPKGNGNLTIIKEQ